SMGKPIVDPEQLQYTHGTTCAYPQYCVTRGVVVVKKMVLNRSLTGERTYRYAYGDGRTDLLGRGWLGFASKRTTDVDTGGVLRETFDNRTRVGAAYPLAGLLTGRSLDAMVGTDGKTLHLNTRGIQYQPLTPVPGTYAAVARVIADNEFEGGFVLRRITTTV